MNSDDPELIKPGPQAQGPELEALVESESRANCQSTRSGSVADPQNVRVTVTGMVTVTATVPVPVALRLSCQCSASGRRWRHSDVTRVTVT